MRFGAHKRHFRIPLYKGKINFFKKMSIRLESQNCFLIYNSQYSDIFMFIFRELN